MHTKNALGARAAVRRLFLLAKKQRAGDQRVYMPLSSELRGYLVLSEDGVAAGTAGG